MNSCLTQENVSCSSLFEEVHLSITIIHAIITALINLVSLPLNCFLTVSVIIYLSYMEKSFVYVISMFFSNIIVSIFFGGGVFLSSAMRDWPLRHFGCQVFGFAALAGLTSRWLAMGIFSIDRTLRVFIPFHYPRWVRRILKFLVTLPWIMIGMHIPLLMNVGGRIDFVDHFPTCLINQHCDDDDSTCRGVQIAWVVWCLLVGGLVPVVFFTVMYVKSKVLSRADQSPVMGQFGEFPERGRVGEFPVMGEFVQPPNSPREEVNRSQGDDSQADQSQGGRSQDNHSQTDQSQADQSQVDRSQADYSQDNRSQVDHSRANRSQAKPSRPKRSQSVIAAERKVNLTYFLMMVNFSISMLLLLAVVLCSYVSFLSPSILIPVSFFLTDCFQVYSIIDFVLVWKNVQGKETLRKLIRDAKACF